LVGIDARIIRATDEGHTAIIDELLLRAWPEATRRLIHDSEKPFLVFISVGFDDFDPSQHDWRIIFFEGAKTPRRSLPILFERLQESIDAGNGLFDFLDRAASGQSNYGTIIGPDLFDAAVRKREPGRPGVFDPELGVEEWLREQAEPGAINLEDPNWQRDLVGGLMAAKPGLRDLKPKSVLDALRRRGYLNAIQNAL